MDREISRNRTIIRSYVLDDGLNLPKEIIEIIDIAVEEAWDEAYARVCAERDRHKGKWLSLEAAKSYEARSWVFRVNNDYQYVGMVRELGEELQREYGVTELEAQNILNGMFVNEYVNKYDRIRNAIPNYVDAQTICNNIANNYLAVAI